MTNNPEHSTADLAEREPTQVEREISAMDAHMGVLEQHFPHRKDINVLDDLNTHYHDKRQAVMDTQENMLASDNYAGYRSNFESGVSQLMTEGYERDDAESEYMHRYADEKAGEATRKFIDQRILHGKLGYKLDGEDPERDKLSAALLAVATLDKELWRSEVDNDGNVVAPGWRDEFLDIQNDEQDEDTTELGSVPDGRGRRALDWTKDRYGRAKTGANNGLVAAAFVTGNFPRELKRKDGETDEQYRERVEKRGKRRAAIGAIALVAFGGIAVWARSRGHSIDIPEGFDGPDLMSSVEVPEDATWDLEGTDVTGEAPLDGGAVSADVSDDVVAPEKEPSGGDSTDAGSELIYGNEAVTITPGEGFYQTFKELGVDRENWEDLLQKVGPRLGEMHYSDNTHVAYFDDAHQEWRINMSDDGRMLPDALDYIADVAHDEGYLPDLDLADLAKNTTPDTASEPSGIEDARDAVTDTIDKGLTSFDEQTGLSELVTDRIDDFQRLENTFPDITGPETIDESTIPSIAPVAVGVGLLGVPVAAGAFNARKGAGEAHVQQGAEATKAYAPDAAKLKDLGVTKDQWAAFIRDIAPTMRNLKYADGTPVAERVGLRGWKFNTSKSGEVHPLIERALITTAAKRGWKK